MVSYDMYSVINKGEIAIMTTTRMLDRKGFTFFFPHFLRHYLFFSFYTCQPFCIYRHDIFYLKSAKIFRKGPIISEDGRRRSKDF